MVMFITLNNFQVKLQDGCPIPMVDIFGLIIVFPRLEHGHPFMLVGCKNSWN